MIWNNVTSNITVTLRSISAVPGATWAVGGDTIWRWDGSAWQPAITGGYSAVDALSANDAWAVGGYHRTLTAHWNGANWTVVPSPNPSNYGGPEANALLDVTMVAA